MAVNVSEQQSDSDGLHVKMGHTLLCVLSLFLSSALIYGNAEAASASLTLQPNWNQIFSGESITLTCNIQGGGGTEWTYEWTSAKLNTPPTHNEHVIDRATESDSGDYRCRGKKDNYFTEWSNVLTLTISDKPKPTLTADKTTIRPGERVILTCSVDRWDGWKFYWYRRLSDSSEREDMNNNGPWDRLTVISEGGLYSCRGGRGDPLFFTELSNEVRIEKIVLSRRPSWSQIYRGEKITVTCQIEGGTEWTYEWSPAKLNTHPTHNEHVLNRATVSDSGDYRCRGKKDNYFTEWSNVLTLTISADKPKPTLTADKTTIRPGESVTLTCSVDRWDGWKLYLYLRTSDSSQPQVMTNNQLGSGIIRVSEGGLYFCRGGRGDPLFFTELSNEVRIEKIVPTKVTVSRRPGWSPIYSGEKVTVTCQIEGGTEWTYEWGPAKLNTPPTHNEHMIDRATVSDSGDYRCRGKKDFSLTEWSNVLTLTISATKPQAELRPDNREVPVGGRVTLTCSVNTSSGWTYYWYRGDKFCDPLTRQDADFYSSGRISVSQGGLYWCRGGRGNPVYYTENSQSVRIDTIGPNRATVTLHPNWTKLYSGEMITVRCEIQGGGDEWEYEWETPTSNKASHQNEFRISSVSSSHSGNYRCKGRMNNAKHDTTEWSGSITLTVYHNKPRPVLTVSPSWLSPGASVTLNCEVEHPSAGWRFYWFKTVPDLSDKYYRYYRYELLPGRDNGTEQNSSIIHGQTHTAGYVCRAGRGDPVYYTDHSEPQFVWSGDVHPSASLTVNPDRVQHFTSDSVSLSCEGNSTEWTVRRFTDGGFLSHCSHWGTMTGSTCKIFTSQSGTAVYWCESGTGEFSNSVNITVHNTDIILVSPVHPVTEGESVTVGCKLRNTNFVSSVFFYQNDKLRQNDTRQELNISAVSKSDEGFYKCQYSGKESPQSWLSVKAVSKHETSSLPVALIIGLVCGILLIIFLLLLYHFTQSKDSCIIRQIQSDSTSRDASTNHGVNRNEKEHNEYSSPLRVEDCICESIKDSGNTGNGESQEVTHSLIELKHIEKKRKDHKPEESPVYSNVKTETTGKSSAAATDESVYSEVKPGTAVGL